MSQFQNKIASSSLSALLADEIPPIEDTLENKKALLKEKIMDMNYNTEKFLEFCYNKNSYGDDLNKWSYQELSSAIDEFINLNKNENNLNNINSNQNNLSIQNGNITDDFNNNAINKSTLESMMKNLVQPLSIPVIKTREEHLINCMKLPQSLLSEKKIKITLSNPRIIETSFFHTNYVLYDIHTDVTDWHVSRRYSDFIWLRNALKKQFPYMVIPFLPDKKYGGRRFELDFIAKRMHFLEIFLNTLGENENFKASDSFLNFLFISDRMKFEEKIKEIDNILNNANSIKIVENYQTYNGSLYILEDPEEISKKDNYYKNVENFIKMHNHILKRLKYNLKNFEVNQQAIRMNLEELSKDFQLLSELNEKVQMKEEVVQVYDQFKIFTKNWARVVANQKEIFNKNFKYFFKNIIMDNNSYLELAEERKEILSNYMSKRDSLQYKKDKLWKQNDITKWEIADIFSVDRLMLMKDREYAYNKMCTKETNDLNNLYKQLCYSNWCYKNELNKLIIKHSDIFVKNLENFSEKFYETLTDSLNVWTEISSCMNKN